MKVYKFIGSFISVNLFLKSPSKWQPESILYVPTKLFGNILSIVKITQILSWKLKLNEKITIFIHIYYAKYVIWIPKVLEEIYHCCVASDLVILAASFSKQYTRTGFVLMSLSATETTIE